jgi:Sec-independent protein translocase protein TatA
VPFGLGVWEIVILLFGATGLPDVAKRLGSGVREVKDAVADVDPRRMLDSGDEAEKPQARREPPSEDEA